MGVDELRVDAQSRASAPQTADQDICGIELLADRRRRDRSVTVCQYRRPREDLEALDLRKLGNDIFSDSVAEVFVFLDAAEILEVEDSDRFLGLARRRYSPRIALGSALAARIDIPLQSQQIGLQISSALIAKIAILLQRFRQHASELRRQCRIELLHGNRVTVEDRVEDHCRALSLKWECACGHLIEHSAE